MLLEKQRATKPLVHSSLSVPVESVGSSVLPVHLPHVVPSDDIDVDFNEDDMITAVGILLWELEHAEQELALLLRPAHARAEDADYVHVQCSLLKSAQERLNLCQLIIMTLC